MNFMLALVALILAGCKFGASGSNEILQADRPASPQPRANCGRARCAGLAQIERSGTHACFPADNKNTEKPPTCEISAVMNWSNRLLAANDKSFKDLGAFVSFSPDDPQTKIEPFKELNRGAKFEDFASCDGFDMVTTAFDRINKDSSWDGYNMLFAWPRAQPELAKVVPSKSGPSGQTYSAGVRDKLQSILGNPYFKIEALACMPKPQPRVVFGVRETGKSYKDFSYVAKLITVSFEWKNKLLTLGTDWTAAYEFDPNLDHKKWGLSSLEWDEGQQGLLALTTLEDNDSGSMPTFRSQIWLIRDLKSPPAIYNDADGKPFTAPYKWEDIAPRGKGRYIVVSDDDRSTFAAGGQVQPRALNQFRWSELSLGQGARR